MVFGQFEIFNSVSRASARLKRMIPMFAALGFTAVFICIIGIANRGEGAHWWSFLNRIPYGDKLGHLVLVGTLSLLCNLAFRGGGTWRIPRAITATTLVLLVLLTLEEIAQAFLPYRTCDFYDWLADLAGLATGQFLARRIHPLIST